MAFRIDSPGALDGRFTEGNPASGTPATVVSADWLTMVQEEIIGVLAGAGLAPNRADNAQLFAAVRALILQQAGLIGDLRNTDVSNLLGMIQALQGRASFLENQRVTDVTNLNNYNFGQDGRLNVLESKTNGRLIARNYAGYSGQAGNYQFGAQTYWCEITLVGGGGAGGTASGTPGGQGASAPGGAAGSVSRFIVYNVAAVFGANRRFAYYIGGGGAPSVGATGASGQQSACVAVESGLYAPNTTFLTAPGGQGGNGQVPNPVGTSGGQGVGGGLGTALTGQGEGYAALAWSRTDGTPGHSGFSVGASAAVGGHGGDGPWGGGGPGAGAGAAGGSALSWGAGGGGSCGINGSPQAGGGYGFSGLMIVEEFSP